jgi:predicted nucleotidyltransferase
LTGPGARSLDVRRSPSGSPVSEADPGREYNALVRLDAASLDRAIARCLKPHKEVAAAYVFGSVATGRARPDSDIDIGVLLARRLPARRALSYRLALAADLGAALRRSEIDVVVLNDASPLLAQRVLSRGRLVFERSASAQVRFQVQTARRYADVVPIYDLHIRYMKRDAGAGSRHG